MLQENSTAQSEAEKRVISVKTKAGHPVKYSGNPAELPGARYETGLALRRAGAFQMLIKNNEKCPPAERLRRLPLHPPKNGDFLFGGWSGETS